MPRVRSKDFLGKDEDEKFGNYGLTIALPDGRPYHVVFDGRGEANVSDAAAEVLRKHKGIEVIDDDMATYEEGEQVRFGSFDSSKAASAGNLSGTGLTQVPALDPTPEKAEDPEEAQERAEAQQTARAFSQTPALDPTSEDAKAERKGEDRATSAGPARTQREAQEEQTLRDPKAEERDADSKEKATEMRKAEARKQDDKARKAQDSGKGRR